MLPDQSRLRCSRLPVGGRNRCGSFGVCRDPGGTRGTFQFGTLPGGSLKYRHARHHIGYLRGEVKKRSSSCSSGGRGSSSISACTSPAAIPREMWKSTVPDSFRVV